MITKDLKNIHLLVQYNLKKLFKRLNQIFITISFDKDKINAIENEIKTIYFFNIDKNYLELLKKFKRKKNILKYNNYLICEEV